MLLALVCGLCTTQATPASARVETVEVSIPRVAQPRPGASLRTLRELIGLHHGPLTDTVGPQREPAPIHNLDFPLSR